MTIQQNAEKLYKTVNTFFISCVNANGYPITKAVSAGKHRESICECYFCTNTSSDFVKAITKNSNASIYFYSRKLVWKGCSLIGKMQIVDDLKQKQKYWQTKFKKAYPQQAFTDPDFCLLKFTPISGRYYSMFKPQDFVLSKK